jgi:sugar lactone lactonase YvrE
VNGNKQVAMFNNPYSLTKDSVGNIYVADTLNNAVRIIVSVGYSYVVSTLCNTGLTAPIGITVDDSDIVYVTSGNKIMKIPTTGPSTGVATTIAGADVSGNAVNTTGALARFNRPSALEFSRDYAYLYVADTNNHVIRSVYMDDGGIFNVGLVAGTPQTPGQIDGMAGDFQGNRLRNPIGLTVDVNGQIYIADTGNNAIRLLYTAPGGIKYVGTFAGPTANGNLNPGDIPSTDEPLTPPLTPYSGYASLTAARFTSPTNTVLDSAGQNLYVTDLGNNRVRRIDLIANLVYNYAGNGQGWVQEYLDTTRMSSPSDIMFGLYGEIYVVDSANNSIIKISANAEYQWILENNIVGSTGATGAAGRTGATGPIGFGLGVSPMGEWTSGSTYIGSTSPTPGTRIDIVTYNGSLYLCTQTIPVSTVPPPADTANWRLYVSVGATGAVGRTGATGAVAPTGATGPQGIRGATGLPGSAVFTGSTGPTGPAGFGVAVSPKGVWV